MIIAELKKYKSLLLIFSMIFFTGCSEGIKSESEVKKIIENNLTVGDSKSKIEMFLEKQNWAYEYDNNLNMFQARNMKEDEYPDSYGRNVIYIYTDEEHRFLNFEVQKIYPN